MGHGSAVCARRAGALLLAALAGVASAWCRAQAFEPPPSEYEVKAAFLYNFSKFVTWPAESFAREDDPIRVTILGEDPFGAAADVLAGRTVEGRRLALARAGRLEDLGRTHILFISSSERQRLPRILEKVRGQPLLTVGDHPGMCEDGVMLNLVRQGGRIGFEVNLRAVGGSPLQISSRLLQLGRVVAR